MLNLQLESGNCSLTIINCQEDISINEIWNNIESKGLVRKDFYILNNGRVVYDEDAIISGNVKIIPRLVGGKGGFGSMLRAIGAQIEKTTNREACRDLSGRRLRDINEEKRLKTWIEKQALREEEAAERKKKKLERLCAEPKHEFKDQHYEHERSVLTEKIDDAIEQGFKVAVTDSLVLQEKEVKVAKGVKRKTILDDDDIDSDELDSSDDEAQSSPKKKFASESNDSSADDKHISSSDNDEFEKSNQNSDKSNGSEIIDNSNDKKAAEENSDSSSVDKSSNSSDTDQENKVEIINSTLESPKELKEKEISAN
ncbi:splicing regulator SDE2 [Microplitis mediator]|uniref:splicing regulator SDE2 n=1 Tax=Microplitis mediator TaxID=375433 RepID=UPI0025526F25|nr:splicing regulator SDE2 [Microplitis mediator]